MALPEQPLRAPDSFQADVAMRRHPDRQPEHGHESSDAELNQVGKQRQWQRFAQMLVNIGQRGAQAGMIRVIRSAAWGVR
ncbi:hypothetical protein RM96_31485 [Cupriavidus sp. IDO]|nr:hypothetical protein RM96_31485 [Cupriavidus sp. IDO]